jgi:hypothetical protein
MKSMIAMCGLFLIAFHYVNYSSLSDPVEVDRDRCEAAIEDGVVYRDPIDLKTLYPLTQPVYRLLDKMVYQLHGSYHDGRSMVCLEYKIK